ncbi:transcription cofactor vestigial-like protein 3 isoform X2 [Mercenaria mercenaria]|uniref:transcription cofactor vestigial-like protein 3 isoform X2 n=1 Tax=Mercenaria mercenaria TaxID=6596 RepID=UPI001E1E0D3A|nr:transcription cofactor vestigial-like protein 3 isoform X2 [Mercenaria mercenaria]
MSVDVMYQPYSASFGYQRNNEHSMQPLCLPKAQEPLDLGIYPSSASSLGHALPGPSLGPHMSSFGLHTSGLGHSAHGNIGNTSTTQGNIPGLKEEDKSEQPKDTQYLSANCVLMTYYSGDISSNVDEHFSRALSQPSSYSPDGKVSKDPSLMCQRKFPASFWNSNYYGPGSFYSDFQFPSGHYSTSSIPGFSGFQDPWFSRFSSQSHTFHHRPMHYDFPYSSMSASRYNSNIGSLLLQSARSGHFPGSDYGKSADTKFRYPDYRLGTEYPTQNSFPGLEATATETTAGRDLYLY